MNADSFLTKGLQWDRQNETLQIVDDQISNPIWARMLAEVTGLILARGVDYIEERKGLYHLAGGGYASRHEWARTILEFDPNKQEQTVTELLPALTAEFQTPAQRPIFSALDCSKFERVFALKLPGWKFTQQLALGNKAILLSGTGG